MENLSEQAFQLFRYLLDLQADHDLDAVAAGLHDALRAGDCAIKNENRPELLGCMVHRLPGNVKQIIFVRLHIFERMVILGRMIS